MSRKNPFKGAIILTVAACVAVGLYFLLGSYFEKSESQVDNATLLYGGLGRDEIYEIQIRNPSDELLLKKRADKVDSWTLSSKDNTDTLSSGFEADSGSVTGIVSTILAARKEQTLTNIKASDVGLAPAIYQLSVHHGSEATKTLLIGTDTPVDYLVYAQWSDNPEIFLTSRSLRFGIDKKFEELRDKSIFNLQLAELKEIQIKGGSGAFSKLNDLHFVKNKKGEWSTSGERPVALKTDALASFVETLNKTSAKDFASDKPDDREKLGFRRPALEITLVPNRSDSKAQTWKLTEITETDDGAKKTKFYLAENSAPTTYEMASSFQDVFQIDLMKFRETRITNIPNDSVTEISVQGPNGPNLLLVKQAHEWKVRSGDEALSNAKVEKVAELLSALGQLRATEFFDDNNVRRLGLDKPSRVVEITSENQGTSSSKTLFFGRDLGDSLYALNSEGLSAPASVKLDVEKLLPTDIEAYRVEAPKAPSSPPEEAKKGKPVKLEPTVNSPKDVRKLPAPIVKPGHKYTAKMKLSDGKELEIEFSADKAPYTVSNFLHLARNKFYDDVVFHRVIRDFVVQGGDPTGTGTGGPGYKFDNEDNDLKHVRGSLSMAHAGRNTNGSQFFIVLAPQGHLNGLHTVFGQVTKGQDQLDGIAQGIKMTTVEVFEEAL